MKTEVIILILWGITSIFAVVIETFDDMRKSYKKRTYTNKKVK